MIQVKLRCPHPATVHNLSKLHRFVSGADLHNAKYSESWPETGYESSGQCPTQLPSNKKIGNKSRFGWLSASLI